MCPSPARNNRPEESDRCGRGDRFSRSHSLKGRGRIREGLRTFKRRSGKNLTVFYNVRAVEGESLNLAEALEWVFMVPRRTGTAVTRNRIRRQVREIARLWIGRRELSGEIMVRFESVDNKTSTERTLPMQVELKEELERILSGVLRETCES